MLMNAKGERLVIIKRTSIKLNQAIKRGLIVNNAPYGYINCGNGRNEPTVRIDESKAMVIRKAFELFLQGVLASVKYNWLYAVVMVLIEVEKVVCPKTTSLQEKGLLY
jgi:hypothetical protein